MSGIFISYRREDSQDLAGRPFDRLTQRFGKDRVFRDIDAIEPGAKFAQAIAERIGGCDAVVVLIGKGWLEAKNAEGRRRLHLPHDLVKAEAHVPNRHAALPLFDELEAGYCRSGVVVELVQPLETAIFAKEASRVRERDPRRLAEHLFERDLSPLLGLGPNLGDPPRNLPVGEQLARPLVDRRPFPAV